MLYQIQAASLQELKEAYQDCLMKQQRARESGQLLLSRKLAEESEIWRINMLERMEQLSASIGDSQADRRTDGGEQ